MPDMTIEELIAHHGVKGMHWGVHKERDYATRSDRKEAAKNVYSEVNKIYGNRNQVAVEALMRTSVSDLNRKDELIKSGTEFYRSSEIKDEPISRTRYVSTNQQDRDNYNAIGGSRNFTPGLKKYAPVYEHVYRTTSDLKSPSEQKRYNALMKIVKTPSITLDDGSKITGRQYLESLGVGNDLKNLDSAAYGRAVYPTLLASLGNRNLKIGDAYYNNLRDLGYDAIIDDNDRGIMSKTPLILLDPERSIKRTSIRRLTDKDIIDAQKRLRAPSST
jgi:hypothetical protein